MRKNQSDRAKGVVLVSLWLSQSCYPIFKSLLVSEPIYFQPNKRLLSCPYRETHLLSEKLTLVAGQTCWHLFLRALSSNNHGINLWWELSKRNKASLFTRPILKILKFFADTLERVETSNIHILQLGIHM